jgi:hypothetical protein
LEAVISLISGFPEAVLIVAVHVGSDSTFSGMMARKEEEKPGKMVSSGSYRHQKAADLQNGSRYPCSGNGEARTRWFMA